MFEEPMGDMADKDPLPVARRRRISDTLILKLAYKLGKLNLQDFLNVLANN